MMNIKKGFIRLFLVSTIIAGLVGYLIGANNSFKTQVYFSTIASNAERQIDLPECRAIIEKNPTEITSQSGKGVEKCKELGVVWSDVREHHIKKGRSGLVTAQDIRENYEDVWGNYTIRGGLFNAISVIFGYWVVLVVVSLIFFTFRWVWRGFKENKND
jgi:hypothetical protein